jgi:polynucleotide 5'-hydroxyl-kinase GRC3/NOL9
MSTPSAAIVPGSDWRPLRAQVVGTVLVIGKPGLGKTSLVRYLAEHLTAEGQRVGVLSTDMGQASVGVPTCLGLGLTAPWQEPAASWFIGDTTPVGNLLPTVVGAAQLARRACQRQIQTLLVDTTGLVDGPLGCVLKYHKSVAIGVDHVIALQQESELETLLAVLQRTCRAVHRLRPTAAARDRSLAERKQYREKRYRAHFQGGVVVEFDLRQLLNADWTLGLGS